MIEKDHPTLSLRAQCRLLDVNRNRLTKPPGRMTQSDQALIELLDAMHLESPFFGQRQFRNELRKLGHRVGRRRIARLMKIMGIEALCPKPSTSTPSPSNPIYPYLLRGVEITKADEVWCADITYIPMPKGHCYLVAIMDWHTRAVLSWEVSNTADTTFCLRALRRAMETTQRKPKIFNTDQGCQFTSREWVDELKNRGVQISMDGKGRWMDNVFIERLWRSLKYEKLRLWSYETVREVSQLVDEWMDFYNHRRSHQHHGLSTPWEIYDPKPDERKAA